MRDQELRVELKELKEVLHETGIIDSSGRWVSKNYTYTRTPDRLEWLEQTIFGLMRHLELDLDGPAVTPFKKSKV